MQIDTAASAYENELETYKQRYLQLETRNHELEIKVIDFQNKYLQIKERYDLLIYKRFMRSAEKLPLDDKQGLLFTPEAEPEKAEAQQEAAEEEKVEVKSHSRAKRGRKPIDPGIPRDIIIIDIPLEEKTCACGTPLTKIGEEISEKLEIIPEKIRVKQIQRPKYGGLKSDAAAARG
jgi:transposase